MTAEAHYREIFRADNPFPEKNLDLVASACFIDLNGRKTIRSGVILKEIQHNRVCNVIDFHRFEIKFPNLQLRHNLLSDILVQSPEDIVQLEDAIDSRDSDQIRSALLKLQGIAAVVGDRSLEQLTRTRGMYDTSFDNEQLRAVRHAHHQMLMQVQGYLGR